jgi:hypothetical protein
MRRSNSSHGVQLAVSPSQRKLQQEKRDTCRQDRQKPFPDPSQSPGLIVHVIAPSECVTLMASRVPKMTIWRMGGDPYLLGPTYLFRAIREGVAADDKGNVFKVSAYN